MLDSSITPDSSESDTMSENVELPVDIDTLSIDGTRPAVGDQCDLKVTGTVTRLVNQMAYVKPDTINDQPMPAPAMEPNPALDEGTRLERLSRTAGEIPSY
jgi:hypothetical protein